jgi:hypothetical protein
MDIGVDVLKSKELIFKVHINASKPTFNQAERLPSLFPEPQSLLLCVLVNLALSLPCVEV